MYKERRIDAQPESAIDQSKIIDIDIVYAEDRQRAIDRISVRRNSIR